MTPPKPLRKDAWIDVYARIEEVNIREGTVRLDYAIPEPDGVLNLLMAFSLSTLRMMWRASFKRPDAAAYDAIPLESIETGVAFARVKTPEQWQYLMDQGAWMRVQIPRRLPSSNFNDPVLVNEYAEAEPAVSQKLSAIFEMKYWPRISAPELKVLLSKIPEIYGLVVQDVGQGSANALFDSAGNAALYFDTGSGIYQNAKTTPNNLDLCGCGSPIVVLSHWDTDHWKGADHGRRQLLDSVWVVPSQTIGPTHSKFASKILQHNGSIFVVKRNSTPTVHTSSGQRISLRYGGGRISDRNNSGLTLCFYEKMNASKSEAWFFPADATYAMSQNAPDVVHLLVASHHGAALKNSTGIPKPACINDARLIYSFGENNSYKHPRKKAIDSHEAVGWDHTGWDQVNPSGLVRATYTLSNGGHQSVVYPPTALQKAQHFHKFHGDALKC